MQSNDNQVRKLQATELFEGWKNIEKVLYYKSLPYIPKIIQSELISRYYNNSLAGYFRIDKTWELIAKKYYWLIFFQDIKV